MYKTVIKAVWISELTLALQIFPLCFSLQCSWHPGTEIIMECQFPSLQNALCRFNHF